MHMLSHSNILGLIGVCVDQQNIEGPLILSPFMQNGDIKTYLSSKLLDCKEESLQLVYMRLYCII